MQKNRLISELRLIRCENVGPRTFYSLINKYGNAAKALQALPEIASKGGKRKFTVSSIEAAEKEISACEKAGIGILSYSDEAYPERLKHSYDPPPILFYKGNIELLSKDSIGIVGTRNSSANGCAMARKLAADLGKQNYVTVSGLARGVDTEAHKATLETGTIAVVAGGLDSVYPPENEKLFNQIVEKGIVIGENPIGTQPQARHFPQRNRIIAALSLGVLVVEAARRSGSLITADYAAKEGREVFAIPGSPLDPRCSGTNYLIKNGAVMVEDVNDIIDNLCNPQTQKLFEIETEYEMEVSPDNENILREDIIQKLGTSPVEIDELARQSHAPIKLVNEVLLELELAGKLERDWGNKVCLRAS